MTPAIDEPEKYLTRGSEESFKPKTVIIVGNGAIKAGWSPLLEVCRSKGQYPITLDESQLEHLTEDKETLAHLLGNASFLFRAFRADLYCKYTLLGKALPTDGDQINFLNRFLKFRDAIAKSYSNRSIELQAFPNEVTDALKKEDTAVITTNWDLCLWNRPKDFPRLIQLHGAAFNQDSLVFPTEFAPDEMPIIAPLMNVAKKKDTSLSGFVSKNAEHFVYSYARGWWHRELFKAHRTAINWLESATRIVTWGLACNAYDAELNSVISSIIPTGNPFDELIVINPDPQARILQSRILLAKNKVRWVNPVPKKKTLCSWIKKLHC